MVTNSHVKTKETRTKFRKTRKYKLKVHGTKTETELKH